MLLCRLVSLRPVSLNCFVLEEPPNSSNTKVWALDPVTFAASKDVPLKNGAPKPILLLHQTHLPREYHHTKRKSTATNTESSEAGYPRGRSFSPTPKESFEEDGRREYRRLGLRKNYFRKSFSSDNLDNRRSNAAGFSSSCSSTSTASSRSGTCNSRIPMPISYTERFRFKTRHNGLSRSPLVEGFPRSKHEETSLETLKLPPPDPKVIESFSSGSESSGYFTPPAEPPAEPVQTIPKEPPSFIQLEKPDPKEFLERSLTPSPSKSSRSSSSAGSQKVASFVVQECEETSERSQSAKSTKPERISLDEVDFNERRYFGERPFAKSEVNINQSSDEQRKSVSSAPVYQTFNETTINITLPGAIETVVQNTSEVIEIKKTPPEKPRLKRNLSRQLSKRSQGSTPTYPETLAPFQKPKEALNEVIRQLESNDWELTMNGLRGLVRLKRHHHEYLESQMHVIVAALIKQIRNLRSQVARMACKAAAELFSGVLIKKSLEMELEELAAPLLQRTADTNRFLRSDANAALDEMCGALPPPKVVQVVALKGCGHPNALVRATAARLLCNLTQKLGAEKVFQLPKETRDKLLQMGANMLTDGNLETRKYAKMMLGNLCSHAHFQRTMFDVVPTNTLRHIEKTLRTLK